MFDTLPKRAEEMLSWSWAQIEPYYRELAKRELGAGRSAGFLSDWTRLWERLDEIYNRLYVATTVNTADADALARYQRYLDEIYPRMHEAEQELKRKLLAANDVPAGFEVPMRRMQTEASLFRAENLPLLVEEQKLSTQYDRIIGAQTVQWEGKEVTVTQLRPTYQETDRARREQAWRLAAGRQLTDRDAINALWGKFLDLRFRLAANAGFESYRSFRWNQLLRYDYTPANCREFHDAIAEVAVPAVQRIYERRRKRLGVNELRPWDLDVDPLGRAPVHPFRDIDELKSRTAHILGQVDPQLGSYFRTMVAEGLLDLENRKNKAPGGYCTSYATAKRPFIFMNSVGTKDDVRTLLHESGHAAHVFETAALPWYQQRWAGMEFAEVASMSMELLSVPHLGASEGGFYPEEDRARVNAEQLEEMIRFWPYMAVVDAFQHWVYENPQAARNPDDCDACWARLWQRFMPGVDWTGFEFEMKTGWQRKLHIHGNPFYYVEYGLAQLGAVQVWAQSLKNRASAVADYRRALALGGTVSLPELFRAAGARFAFDAGTLREAVGLLEEKIGA